jgi:hypothetical protein
MILHLCEQLRVPLRERNLLLLAAGFAPTFPSGRWTIRRSAQRGRRSGWC